MAQQTAGVEIHSSEEYHEQLTALTVETARKAVERFNSDSVSAERNDSLDKSHQDFFQLIEQGFYQDAPLEVIQFCEYSPRASPSEIAEMCNFPDEYARILARELLAVAVRDGVLSMIHEDTEIGGIRVEQSPGGALSVVEIGESGITPADGWTESDESHPESGVVAFSDGYFKHDDGYELVIWRDFEEDTQNYIQPGDEYAIEVYDESGEMVDASGFETRRSAVSAAELCMELFPEDSNE